jgi:hypothetical protein
LSFAICFSCSADLLCTTWSILESTHSMLYLTHNFLILFVVPFSPNVGGCKCSPRHFMTSPLNILTEARHFSLYLLEQYQVVFPSNVLWLVEYVKPLMYSNDPPRGNGSNWAPVRNQMVKSLWKFNYLSMHLHKPKLRSIYFYFTFRYHEKHRLITGRFFRIFLKF